MPLLLFFELEKVSIEQDFVYTMYKILAISDMIPVDTVFTTSINFDKYHKKNRIAKMFW